MTPKGRTRLGDRLIARIVRAYPAAVRGPHGDELRADTTQRWARARESGIRSAARWWLVEGAALMWGAGAEHVDRLRRRETERWAEALHTLRGDGMTMDLRWLLRDMRRNPAFAASLVLVLSVALGLATAVFSFVDGVLVKPLHYAEGDRIVAVWASRPTEGLDRVSLTQWDIQRLRERTDVFETIGAFSQQRSAMQLPDAVIEIGFGWITTSMHDVLDVEPVLGRTFLESERGELVALLDHGFWMRQFGGDPDVLGATVRIAQQPWTIVGVLPPDMPLELPSRGRVPQPTDVWSIMWVEGEDATSAWMHTVSRLAPGVSVETAATVASQIAEEGRRVFPERAEWDFQLDVAPLREDFTAGISRQLWLVLVGTLVLLFAAISNAGNLMLLQRERRRQRTAVRLAIGASGSRLTATALVEAAVYAGLATVLAIPLAGFALDGLVAWSPAEVPRLDDVAFDGRASLFLAASGALAGVLLTLISVVWNADISTHDIIRPTRGSVGRWSGGRLVATEVAFAVPLVIIGSLLARSALELARIDPGFDAGGAHAVRMALPNHQIDRVELGQILAEYETELSALPGVEEVGTSNLVPLAGGAFTGPIGLQLGELEEATTLEGDYRYITAGSPEALGVELIEGAWPVPEGDGSAVVIDQALAERLWPEQTAIGRTLAARPLGDARDDFAVSAVVSTTRHASIREAGRPTVYFTSATYTLPYVTTIVRGEIGAAELAGPAREIGQRVHPDLLVAEVRPLEEVVAAASALSVWLVVVVLALALGAAVITGIGLYAVVGQFVSGYSRALGIRRALGARPHHVALIVGRRLATTVALGVVAGVVFARIGSTYIRSELVGIEPTDGSTWLVAILTLLALSVLAIAMPTRGAIRLSPLEVLRSD